MDDLALKSVEIIKTLNEEAHVLFHFDQDAARSGERPAEQVVDVSGIAIGGVLVQMSPDYASFHPLAYYSEYLSKSQQMWHPFETKVIWTEESEDQFLARTGSTSHVCLD